MGPDETALRAHLASNRYRLGEIKGKWALVQVTFPIVYFRVRAAPRPESPEWFLFRLDVQGYPGAAPTAQVWDGPSNQALAPELRPHTRAGLMIAFSQWQPCLYHPIDRMARSHWPDQYGELAWSNDKDLTSFLETVYGLVQDPSYLVAKAPPGAAYLPGERMAEPTV